MMKNIREITLETKSEEQSWKKEKKIVSDYFIMGKQVKETAAELGISTRQVSRDKNSAWAKMLKRIKQLDMNHMLRRQVHFCRKAIIFQHRWKRRILL